MHPIERLRWVARSPEGDASLVAAEAADALAGFADDPAGLVIASRRLIERRPAAGPLWWLASRGLCALDPAFEATDAAADLERDRTPAALAGDLPGGTPPPDRGPWPPPPGRRIDRCGWWPASVGSCPARSTTPWSAGSATTRPSRSCPWLPSTTWPGPAAPCPGPGCPVRPARWRPSCCA